MFFFSLALRKNVLECLSVCSESQTPLPQFGKKSEQNIGPIQKVGLSHMQKS